MEDLSVGRHFKTLNAVNGCTARCPYCYARRMNDKYRISKDFSVPEYSFEKILSIGRTRKPTVYFMTSMSDFSDWRREWQDEVLTYLAHYPQHQYMFLTKFPHRIDLDCELDNVWMGTTVTTRADRHRIASLKRCVRAKHHFLSLEPLLGDLGDLDLSGIEWIIIGAETGFREGKVKPKQEWVSNIIAQAKPIGIPILITNELAQTIDKELLYRELPPAIRYPEGCLFALDTIEP